MKTEDKKELHNKSIVELKNLIAKVKDELAQIRLDHSQYKLKNTRMLFLKRKEIARMETILRLKELVKNKGEQK